MPRFLFLLSVFTLLLTSCNSDDGIGENSDPYYQNVMTDLYPEDIQDRWALSQVTYQETSQYITSDFEACGLNFFDLLEGGVYEEYVFLSHNCNYQKNEYNWTLNDGILRIANHAGEYDEYAITALNDNQMKANFKIDINEDGKDEIIKVTFIRYDSPSQGDYYNINFRQDDDNYKIGLRWNQYDGFNTFTKYQLLRKGNCQSDEAEIIAEFDDVSITSYYDASPPISENICYQLKIFTNDSEDIITPVIYVHTDDLLVPAINNLSVSASENNRINLTWDEYNANYFSHYEVRRDYNQNHREYYEVIETIRDPAVYSYETDAAYYTEQYYTVVAVDIFGNKSPYSESRMLIEYTRPEMIPEASTQHFTIDPEEPYIYYISQGSIHKYNYDTNTLTHQINYDYSSSLHDMRIIDGEYGKELIVHETQRFDFYDAASMTLKYSFTPPYSEVFVMDSYELNGNELIITDYDNVYSYHRDNSQFTLINEQPHFPDHQGMYPYLVKAIGEQYVVGHKNESQGLLYDINNENLATGNYISMPLNNSTYYEILYNTNQNYLINSNTGKLYDTYSFQEVRQIPNDVKTTSISSSGNKIFATKNIHDQYHETEDEKSVVIFGYPSFTSTIIPTIGYPVFVFQTTDDRILSLSKGYISGNTDLFIEEIQP